ncbi:olfactory receptor 1361-like [Protobothrops mucrosquamatus]|uniref:olfactory receptor 1361-like n=1 Tax=Protobothrops mucrosquamatus TaxID=103944 RepID=UPI000775ABF5|nr:olfactory receptor 1361-like [Protobothrops mucrosquamatus]
MLASEKGNQSDIVEFILLGFGNSVQLQFLLFLLFLLIYLVTITGNLLIIMLVLADPCLHTPMYFFLGNLSCLETCYTSSISPKMLTNLLTGKATITVSQCLAQYYFFGSFATVETYLLAAMSYDRYLAICRPFLYNLIMSRKLCVYLMAGSWLNGLLANGITLLLLAQLSFCGPNVIDHYFCDLTPVEKLSCTDTSFLDLIVSLLSIIDAVIPFILTFTSYICIIIVIIKIKSSIGRQKAFSNCSSHLMVVCLFYGTIIIVYMLPDTPALRHLNKFFSIFYTILTPLLNPIIYTLRNKDIHKALGWVQKKLRIFGRSYFFCLQTQHL